MIVNLDRKAIGFNDGNFSLFIGQYFRDSTVLGFWSIGDQCDYNLDIDIGECGHLCRIADGCCCNCTKRHKLCNICTEAKR